MPCPRRAPIRRILSDSGCPFFNAYGKAGYWVIAGLILLIVFSIGVIKYWGSRPEDKPSPSVDTLKKQEVFHYPERYKIEKPAKPVADAVVSEAPAQNADEETVQDPPFVPRPMEAAPPIQAPQTADRTAQQVASSPLETDQQPRKDVSGEKAIPGGEHSQDEARNAEEQQPPPAEGPRAEDGAKMSNAVSSEKASKTTGTPSAPSRESAGRQFFVNTDVANVRERPSIQSKVLSRIWRGSSVTVTGQQGGWYSVDMDDGRSGWVSHTLLADTLIPAKDTLPTLREIKAIRVEPPGNRTAKVRFELSAPHVPEILMLGEKRPRVVCDFLDARLSPAIAPRIAVNNGIIQTIRTGLHSQPRVKVRVVLDLEPGSHYEPRRVSGDGEDCFVLEIKAVGNP